MVLDSEGRPYLAYVDSTVGNRVAVIFYDGVTWQKVGGASAVTAGSVLSLQMVMGPDDHPVLAFQDSLQDNKAAVVRFNGAIWTTLGKAGFSSAEAESLSVAVSPSGTIAVAYSDVASDSRAAVLAYTGEGITGWQAWGGNPQSLTLSSGAAQFTKVAFDQAGNLYLAYADSAANNAAIVYRWGGR